MQHFQESFPCKLLLWYWYINFQYDHFVIKFGGYDTPELPCFQAQSGHADQGIQKCLLLRYIIYKMDQVSSQFIHRIITHLSHIAKDIYMYVKEHYSTSK